MPTPPFTAFPIQTVALNIFTSSTSGIVPASGSTPNSFLRFDGVFAVPPGGGTPGGTNGQVQFNNSGVFGGLTNAQLTADINVFTSTLSGAVPGGSGGLTTVFLRGDGQWVAPPSGGGNPPGGSSGQIQWNNAGSFGGFTMSGDATLVTSTGVITISNSAVTYAKMQNSAAASILIGRGAGSGAGVLQEIALGTNLSMSGTTLNATGGGGGGSPGGASLTVQYNNAGSFGGMSGTAWDDTNRALTMTGATVTASNPILNLTQTWNSLGTTFNGIKFVATDTASASNSLLINLSTGSGGKFTVDKFGNMDAFTSNMFTGTITTSTPAYLAQQTWNGGGQTFKLFTANITDTVSAAGSLFENYQIASVDKWNLRKDGAVTVGIWNGTAIAAAFGGTGQTTYLLGDMLYASAPTTLARLPGNTTNVRNFLRQLGTGSVSAAPVWDTITVSDVSGAIAAPSPTIKGCYPTWSNTSGAVTDGQGPVNVLAYATPGVPINTGVNDATTAINAAWAAAPLIYLPAGKYLINGPLVPPHRNGQGLIGDGSYNVTTVGFTGSQWAPGDGGTLIVSSDTTHTLIDCSASGGLSHITFEGFTITRTSQASTGYGITIENGDDHHVNDVKLYNHTIGLHLGVMGGYSIAENIECFHNTLHGFELQGQWQLHNLLAESNGGDGFHVDLSTATSASSGQWSRLSTFNNSGWGFNAIGTSGSAALEGFRISDCFFGNDLTGEMQLNTFAGNAHKFTNCQFEGNNNVQLVVISVNNPTVMFDNCFFTCGGSASAIVSHLQGTTRLSNDSLPVLLVSNCGIEALGAFGAASTAKGIWADGASARVAISNCQIDGFRNCIQVDNGAGGAGTNQQLNVSNCTLWAMSDLFAGAGVVGIFMNSTGGKATVVSTEVAGPLSSANFTNGIIIDNPGATGAATVLGCGCNTNTNPIVLTGTTTTYTAGNY